MEGKERFVGRGEIAIFNPDESVRLDVRIENETVWLTRSQLSELFSRDIKTIGKHIANALSEELSGLSTVAKFATVQIEGNREVTRFVEHYNLDMILSIGYRVKSVRGVQFRRWANTVLKEYLLSGYAVNRRLEELEKRTADNERKIDFFVRMSLPPVEGIFFEGQIFDAYVFASDIIKRAVQRIVLIDNYIDESVLTILDKRRAGVRAEIYTRNVSEQVLLDLRRHDAQYPPLQVKTISGIHDRFLVIDREVYHLGASLKDLGKKMFAFSKINDESLSCFIDMLENENGLETTPHP